LFRHFVLQQMKSNRKNFIGKKCWKVVPVALNYDISALYQIPFAADLLHIPPVQYIGIGSFNQNMSLKYKLNLRLNVRFQNCMTLVIYLIIWKHCLFSNVSSRVDCILFTTVVLMQHSYIFPFAALIFVCLLISFHENYFILGRVGNKRWNVLEFHYVLSTSRFIALYHRRCESSKGLF